MRKAEEVFLSAWLRWLFLSIAVALVVVIVLTIIGTVLDFFWIAILASGLILITPVVTIAILRWKNRVEVPANWEYLYEWSGEKLLPLTPGLYFPFPYLGFLSEASQVLMSQQTIYIFSGVRDVLSTDEIKKYKYGSQTNIEPGTGDVLRLKYAAEFQCVDSFKLVYTKKTPFVFMAGLLELEVVKFAKTLTGEKVNDKFVKYQWDKKLAKAIATIEAEVGVKIIRFMPIDVINTSDTEKSRLDVELKKREREVLNEELLNMAVKKKISAEADSTRSNAIKAIKDDAGVNGIVALKFLSEQKKLDTIEVASKKGNITYMDSSGSGKLNDSFTLGWGLNAHNSTSNQSPNGTSVDPNDNGNQGAKKPVTVKKKN
ncbi:MAG: hypothetical protein WAW11_01085 [Patescibacteria group bacterium]